MEHIRTQNFPNLSPLELNGAILFEIIRHLFWNFDGAFSILASNSAQSSFVVTVNISSQRAKPQSSMFVAQRASKLRY